MEEEIEIAFPNFAVYSTTKSRRENLLRDSRVREIDKCGGQNAREKDIRATVGDYSQ
jgi:hypothetical protein